MTRSLKYHLPKAHILALDADEAQTNGARKWEERLLPNASPPISHKTLLINPENLIATIDDWITTDGSGQMPASVIFVALHACGSLTPDIFRTYFASVKRKLVERIWTAVMVVVVGCCYNLMYPTGDQFHQPLCPLTNKSYI